MEFHPAGSRPSAPASPDYFTGQVRQDPVITCPDPARARAVVVTFEPGARTNWHTHPLGQTLYILSGAGRIQTEGGEIRAVRPGDTVYFAPGEKHWHGAAPDCALVHLAIHEALEGTHVDWMEPVTDNQYGG